MRSSTALIMAIISILVCLPVAVNSQTGWRAPADVVERLSKSQPQYNYHEEKVPAYTLPRLLTANDGRTVTDAAAWNDVRRQEILELFRENVYGRVPETPYTQNFRVVRENRNAMDGAATLREVDIEISSEGRSLTIRLSLFVPNNAGGKVPAFLLSITGGQSRLIPHGRSKMNSGLPKRLSHGHMLQLFFRIPMWILIILMISKMGFTVFSIVAKGREIHGGPLQPGHGVQAVAWITWLPTAVSIRPESL